VAKNTLDKNPFFPTLIIRSYTAIIVKIFGDRFDLDFITRSLFGFNSKKGGIMKKLSFVLLVSLLFSMVTYGQSWQGGSGVLYANPTSAKVAIGRANPVSKFHVSGGHIAVDGQYGISFGNWATNTPPATPNAQLVLGGALNTGYNIGTKLLIEGIDNEANYKAISVVDENSNELFFLQSTPINDGQTYFKGNVGIGTTSPGKKLDVIGDIRIPINNRMYFGRASIQGYSEYYHGLKLYGEVGGNPSITIKPSGRVGIGTTDAGEQLEVNGTVLMTGFSLPTNAQNGYVLTSDANGEGTWQPLQWSENGNDIYFNTGQVCIGGTTPQSALTVDGTITTKELKVKLTGWSDFVFADNYKLMPLNKLEKHIKKERSLPGIPTNKEVVKEGVLVGEMQAKLLEKVEELTLYVIELNKEVGNLRKENEDLKQKISALNR